MIRNLAIIVALAKYFNISVLQTFVALSPLIAIILEKGNVIYDPVMIETGVVCPLEPTAADGWFKKLYCDGPKEISEDYRRPHEGIDILIQDFDFVKAGLDNDLINKELFNKPIRIPASSYISLGITEKGESICMGSRENPFGEKDQIKIHNNHVKMMRAAMNLDKEIPIEQRAKQITTCNNGKNDCYDMSHRIQALILYEVELMERANCANGYHPVMDTWITELTPHQKKLLEKAQQCHNREGHYVLGPKGVMLTTYVVTIIIPVVILGIIRTSGGG